MPINFEERREHRQKRVKQLERRLRDIRRKQSWRERRRALHPVRNVVLLVLVAAVAWVVLPRVFDTTSRADAATETSESTRGKIEEMQVTLIEDVSDAIGVEIEPPRTSINLDGAVIDGWSTPLDVIDHKRATRPHHTYAAWDYGTEVGTPVYAMTAGIISQATSDDDARCGGTVIISTESERAQITYCHLSEVFVVNNELVEAGDLIGLTGGRPGARGAGRSSGPHLHLQIKLDGVLHCPQAQLVALNSDQSLPVRDLPTSGCSYSSEPFGVSGDTDAVAALGDAEYATTDSLFVWD